MEILHARSICVTDKTPTKLVGNVLRLARSVVCGACGRAGDLAYAGHEEVVRNAWATRNGYTLTHEDGHWVVALPGRRIT